MLLLIVKLRLLSGCRFLNLHIEIERRMPHHN
nr:MAG TPA: hypothetical protein [Caudoviricetes sp.]